MSGLGIVLDGGGALAAYQAGVLAEIAEIAPDLHTPHIAGISAGAINATALAATTGPLAERAKELVEDWRTLTIAEVFRGGLGNSLKFATRHSRTWQLDSKPLERRLSRKYGAVEPNGTLPRIEANLASGALNSLAVTALSYTSGRSVTFTHSNTALPWASGHREGRITPVGVPHVMASAALPMVFPPIAIGDEWFGDGGMQATAPLDAVTRPGADRVLVISPRPGPEAFQLEPNQAPDRVRIAEILGNALFVGSYEDELERLAPDLRSRSLLIRPSIDLLELAQRFRPRIPLMSRTTTRLLGLRHPKRQLLATLMFQPDFAEALIEQGRIDVRDQDANALARVLGVGQS